MLAGQSRVFGKAEVVVGGSSHGPSVAFEVSGLGLPVRKDDQNFAGHQIGLKVMWESPTWSLPGTYIPNFPTVESAPGNFSSSSITHALPSKILCVIVFPD